MVARALPGPVVNLLDASALGAPLVLVGFGVFLYAATTLVSEFRP